MADSYRRRILDYLRDTTLAAITTGNGYNYTLGTIERGLKEMDGQADSKFPAVYIGHADEERQNITGNQFQSRMRTLIIGHVKNSSGTSGLQGNIDDLIEDLSKALEQDRKLGGLAKWIEVKSVVGPDGDVDAFGTVGIIVEIVYVTEGVNP